MTNTSKSKFCIKKQLFKKFNPKNIYKYSKLKKFKKAMKFNKMKLLVINNNFSNFLSFIMERMFILRVSTPEVGNEHLLVIIASKTSKVTKKKKIP